MRATTARLEYLAAPVTAVELGTALRFARNVALLLAAPFIGLVYAVALPFVGMGMLVWMGVRAARAA